MKSDILLDMVYFLSPILRFLHLVDQITATFRGLQSSFLLESVSYVSV